MWRFIFFAFIGALLMKNDVTLSITRTYPSNLAWLFSSKNKLNESKETTRNVCKSQECEKIAKAILENMDKSLDPCDDFYEYACAKWPEHTSIPKGYRSWNLLSVLQMNVEQRIHDILKEGSKNDDLLAVKLAKKWYKVCMNTNAMDKQGLDPLITTISRIGGWPMIMDPDEWDEHEYSWQKVDDQYVRLTGQNAFHDVRVNRYDPNKTAQIATPHLPVGTYKLWTENLYNRVEIEDIDEDPSDEEDDEEPASDQEGSGDENDDNDSDDDDDDDETNKQNKYEDQKKKISKRTSRNKLNHKKDTKMQHKRKTKNDTRVLEKHNSHKTKKQREKRRAIPTKIHNKLAQHHTHREKLRKSKKNHVKRIQNEDKTKESMETVYTSTTPRITTEETSDEGIEIAQQVYANYISKVARIIAEARGVEVSEEHIVKDIEDMIKFQVKLSMIVRKSNNKWENLELTLSDFQEWYNKKEHKTTNSKINWVYKIEELFDEAHRPVNGDLNLYVRSSDYFEALAPLLDETSKRTIVNYIHWNFISRLIETSTNELRKLYYKWKEWEGKKENEKEDEDDVESEEEERISMCTKNTLLKEVIAYEYLKRYFSDNITKTAEDMVDDIQKEIEYQIKESDWLDDDTKDYVFAKLLNMRKFIGYADWYRNNTIIKRYLQGLIVGNSYYENTLSYNRYRKWKELRELKKDESENDGEDEDDVWIDPLMVNAFFSPWANSITLSAADFQSPFFDYNRPQAINYGFVGVIMGHEVNHGFDDNGITFNKKGEFVKLLSILSEEYSKRVNCFVEQLNNHYSIGNRDIWINRTSGQDIADTMGLQASFRAYKRRERECEKADIVLPGLEDVTSDQLFFLSFANLWCEATIDSNTDNANSTANKVINPYSGHFRVICPVSNSEEFAKAFNCPVGSPMNPEKKCNIWK